MSAVTVCLHYKYGFCKHREHCWKEHLETKCESSKCDGRNCEKRHPRECRFYNDYGRCKFGEFCLYNHVDRNDPVLEDLKLVKTKLEMVEFEILEIKHSFEKLELALRTIVKKEAKAMDDATTEDEKEKSPEINAEGDSGIYASSQGFGDSKLCIEKSRQISELDICDDSQAVQFDSGILSSMSEDLEAPLLFEKDESSWLCLCCNIVGEFETEAKLQAHHNTHRTKYDECDICYIPPEKQCRNCDTVFENKKLLSEHYIDHQAGCDDCRMCFSSCSEADLHELYYHPEDKLGVWKHLHPFKEFLLLLMARPPSFSLELMTLVLYYIVANHWFGSDLCGSR